MNILFYLTRYPGVGGIETVTSQITESLVLDKGYNIDIISHWQQEWKGAYVSGKIFPMPNDKNWTAPENFAYACDVVKNGNYDVIIYQDSTHRPKR